jgi:FKBP-type peptidyl-prolyl cis-trans isomerase FklB
MKKISTKGINALAATVILCGGAALAPAANARQTSTATAASSQAPAASAPATPAAKPKTTPAAKSATPSSTAAGAGSSAKPKGTSASAGTALTTDKQKASYALGMNIAAGLSQQMDPKDIDKASLLQGFKDTLAGAKPAISMEEAVAALKKLQDTVQKEEEAAVQQAGETNQKAGDAFLAANKSKEGVVALPSGLQYKVLTEGTGPKPAATDTVVCNYRGSLLDGKEFDSSYKRGQPATFPLNQVIKGWTEGVQLMSVGSKYEFYIPAALAYGARGAGADIGPNSTLIFQVELISIKGK